MIADKRRTTDNCRKIANNRRNFSLAEEDEGNAWLSPGFYDEADNRAGGTALRKTPLYSGRH